MWIGCVKEQLPNDNGKKTLKKRIFLSRVFSRKVLLNGQYKLTKGVNMTNSTKGTEPNETIQTSSTYLSFQEALEFLNVKESWLRMAVFKKQIPHHKFNRLIRFEINDLLLWTYKNKIEK